MRKFYPGITAVFLLFFAFLFLQITPIFAGNVGANPPIITSVSPSTISSTSVVIHWTTNVDSSSKVDYGLSNSYGASTVETDTSPLVIDHSVALSGFISCSTYHYRVRSKNATNIETVDSDNTFTTTGCTGSATVDAQNSAQITTASGGSLALNDNNSHGLSLT